MIEIRLFGSLQRFGAQKGWSFPHKFLLKEECSATQLAQMLELPLEEIEGVFIDGIPRPLKGAQIKPGQRIAFIPYGIPGPYRVMFGLKNK
ncbi:MAG: MoaD/ThiS family protein [Zhaonellaceae bacterium]|jgi:hypothetical protein|nr:MoaD/ThiS family protein [Clostridia bacterium]